MLKEMILQITVYLVTGYSDLRIRAAERLLRTSTEYLEKKLKPKVNTEKSRAVSVYSIRNFGFLALRWEGTEAEVTSEFTQNPRRKPKRS